MFKIQKVISDTARNINLSADEVQKFDLYSALSRFSPDERVRLQNSINEINGEFLEKLLGPKLCSFVYDDGRFSADGIKMILDAINLDNLSQARKIIAEIGPESDLLPYEIVKKLNGVQTKLVDISHGQTLINKSQIAKK